MSFYMKLENVDGSVTTKGHEKSVELESIDLGVQRNVKVKPGHTVDREYGIPKISDFVVTKIMDKASPYLFEASCVGNSMGKVIIKGSGASNDSDNFLQYTLDDVIISHYSVSGINENDSNHKPMETLNLNYSKIEMKYIPRNNDNKPMSPISSGYDVSTASKI